jgi:hypothetical protein
MRYSTMARSEIKKDSTPHARYTPQGLDSRGRSFGFYGGSTVTEMGSTISDGQPRLAEREG